MKITIIGAGYVGLSLAMLLSSDNEVTIVDKDEKKIEMINDGVSPLRESDIIKAFAENKDSIIATSSIEEPLINADLIIIAVSTDFNNELNRFELHNVESIYRKGGNKGFDTAIIRLQEQCYVITSNFAYMTDKNGQPYGWGVAEYSTPEKFMGAAFTDKVYQREPEESYQLILDHLKKILPQASMEQIKKILK